MTRKILLILVALAAGLSLTMAAQAQGGDVSYPSDDDVNAIAKQLYCPVCPNTPLDVCETQACKDWRAQIRDQLAAGWSEEQIIDYFVTQYGERVLAEPRRQGFTSLVWLLPVIAVALGLAVVTQVLKSWKAARSTQAARARPTVEASPETLARVEQALRELW